MLYVIKHFLFLSATRKCQIFDITLLRNIIFWIYAGFFYKRRILGSPIFSMLSEQPIQKLEDFFNTLGKGKESTVSFF